MPRKSKESWEFGDFQTPLSLAVLALEHLKVNEPDFKPKTIIEPTCGIGAFLFASADAYPEASKIIGVEIEAQYLEDIKERIRQRHDHNRFSLFQGDFFKMDWEAILKDAPKPILVVGNPPWVTSADIGRLRGSNLPEKSNFQKYTGFEAVTGKSNFDISEWMLLRHLEWLSDHSGCLAMLCKSAVARKLLRQAWKSGVATVDSQMVKINAREHFGASVDACFFVVRTNSKQTSTDCRYFDSFQEKLPNQVFGYHEGMMLSDVPKFYALHHLLGYDPCYTWRSGVKHDCSKVMELRIVGRKLVNGLKEGVDIEDDYLFPLLKSSDLGNRRTQVARYKVIVTQKRVGAPTNEIELRAPKTWTYLNRHGVLLDARGSTIYRNKPRFSIFGIGPYSFTNWKVAISGFYKRLDFQIVGPIDDRPVMFDDTVYFLAAISEEEASFLGLLLASEQAHNFLSSMAFWSDKRPITVDLLKRLHIGRLAEELGKGKAYREFAAIRCNPRTSSTCGAMESGNQADFLVSS